MSVRVIEGDCRKMLATLGEASADSVVCDPPYDLTGASRNGSPRANDPAKPFGRHRLQDKGFMGQQWDGTGVAFDPETWAAVLRVLKPGAYLLAFGGTRTYHRMTCAIEDAGFQIRDCLMWVYGTGFPKGQGCLKPAYEPIVLARKPGPRVLPLGIDACRVPTDGETIKPVTGKGTLCGTRDGYDRPWKHDPAALARRQERADAAIDAANTLGRYPANLLHDGSGEVLEAFAAFGERKAGVAVGRNASAGSVYGNGKGLISQDKGDDCLGYGDSGTAARFFYTAKASKAERGEGNNHPTVKPLALVRWLVRLVTPEGGTVLDPFGGSGTTGLAAQMEGRNAVLVEKHPPYVEIIRRRLADAESPLFTGGQHG